MPDSAGCRIVVLVCVVPAGLAFSTPGGTLAAIEDLAARCEMHRRSARELAEADFGAAGVLTRLLWRTLSPFPGSATTLGRRGG
jgi:hypothetical protein